MIDTDALHQVAALPGVPEAVQAARDACTGLRWHRALRRRTDEARAESTARAARATAMLDGAELPLDVVRDMLRGAIPTPAGAVGEVVAGAIRAVVVAGSLGPLPRTASLQALARLHTAAAAGLVPQDALGRPRGIGESPGDLPGPGPAPEGDELTARLEGLGALLAAAPDVPALVVAALVHAEVMAIRPFTVGSGVVARALFRAVVIDRGLDPTGVAVPEVACAATGLPEYAAALHGYVRGTAAGVGGWLVYCARMIERGAAEGEQVADAVMAGRLSR